MGVRLLGSWVRDLGFRVVGYRTQELRGLGFGGLEV